MRHSLRGLCGLKFKKGQTNHKHPQSQPARAVWIEIQFRERHVFKLRHSLRGLCGLKYAYKCISF